MVYHDRKDRACTSTLVIHGSFVLVLNLHCLLLSSWVVRWCLPLYFIYFIYWALAHSFIFKICKINLSSLLLFRAPVYFNYEYQDVHVHELVIVYTKCSSIPWVDVRLQEWIPHQFIPWYWNIDRESVRPLKDFHSPLVSTVMMAYWWARLSIRSLVCDFV